MIVSVVLLALFALSLPFSLRRDRAATDDASRARTRHRAGRSGWRSACWRRRRPRSRRSSPTGSSTPSSRPWTRSAISEAFAGLVVVAIAGNAVENVVGIQLAAKGQSEYAFSVVLNSPIQIALVLAPVLVLVSQIFGLASFTLVFSPLLVVVLLLAIILAAFIAFDGESTWLEGASLIALYGIIATASGGVEAARERSGEASRRAAR